MVTSLRHEMTDQLTLTVMAWPPVAVYTTFAPTGPSAPLNEMAVSTVPFAARVPEEGETLMAGLLLTALHVSVPPFDDTLTVPGPALRLTSRGVTPSVPVGGGVDDDDVVVVVVVTAEVGGVVVVVVMVVVTTTVFGGTAAALVVVTTVVVVGSVVVVTVVVVVVPSVVVGTDTGSVVVSDGGSASFWSRGAGANV
jgi:hypothetical protein